VRLRLHEADHRVDVGPAVKFVDPEGAIVGGSGPSGVVLVQ
jgi:hypothetical protein